MTRAQLLAAGVSRSAIDRAVRAGRLHRVHRGVYAAVAPELLTEEGHLVAALLAAGEGALLSHGTAAWRWRIIPAPPSVIELAVPRDHAQIEGLTVFVSRNLRAGDSTPQRPLPHHLRPAHPPGPRHPLRPPRAAQSARGSRVPARPAPADVERTLRRGHPGSANLRAALKAHAPGHGEMKSRLERRFRDAPHPPRHRAAAAQPVRRAVDGRLPVARAPRRRRARRPPARAPAPGRLRRRPRPLAAPPPLRGTPLRQTPDRAAARRRHRRPPRRLRRLELG